jgi:hypothetical protein
MLFADGLCTFEEWVNIYETIYVAAGIDGDKLRLKSKPQGSKPKAQVYGEALPPLVDRIITTVAITDKDIFYDIGSGNERRHTFSLSLHITHTHIFMLSLSLSHTHTLSLSFCFFFSSYNHFVGLNRWGVDNRNWKRGDASLCEDRMPRLRY